MLPKKNCEEANTYSCLDGQLRSRLSQAEFRRIHRRVHVHYDSFRRQCRSYVSLKESVEAQQVMDATPTSHPPLACHREERLWYLLVIYLQSFARKDCDYFNEAVNV